MSPMGMVGVGRAQLAISRLEGLQRTAASRAPDGYRFNYYTNEYDEIRPSVSSAASASPATPAREPVRPIRNGDGLHLLEQLRQARLRDESDRLALRVGSMMDEAGKDIPGAATAVGLAFERGALGLMRDLTASRSWYERGARLDGAVASDGLNRVELLLADSPDGKTGFSAYLDDVQARGCAKALECGEPLARNLLDALAASESASASRKQFGEVLEALMEAVGDGSSDMHGAGECGLALLRALFDERHHDRTASQLTDWPRRSPQLDGITEAMIRAVGGHYHEGRISEVVTAFLPGLLSVVVEDLLAEEDDG